MLLTCVWNVLLRHTEQHSEPVLVSWSPLIFHREMLYFCGRSHTCYILLSILQNIHTHIQTHSHFRSFSSKNRSEGDAVWVQMTDADGWQEINTLILLVMWPFNWLAKAQIAGWQPGSGEATPVSKDNVCTKHKVALRWMEKGTVLNTGVLEQFQGHTYQ